MQTHTRVRGIQGESRRISHGRELGRHERGPHAEELEHKAAHESALVERLNVTTKAAGIAPWEFDIKSNCFSWHGPRPPCFGMDDVPLQDYFRAILTPLCCPRIATSCYCAD